MAGSVYCQITLTTPGAQAGHWNVTVTPTFETSARELTDQQLAKAGYRLAEVLKKIFAVRISAISYCVETEFRGLSRYQTGVW